MRRVTRILACSLAVLVVLAFGPGADPARAQSFRLASTTVTLVDGDGSEQTAVGTVIGDVMTLSFLTPLDATNLAALSAVTPSGSSPFWRFDLAAMPSGTGTINLHALLKDGVAATRLSGQRLLSIPDPDTSTYRVNWTCDGTTLAFTAPAATVWATYVNRANVQAQAQVANQDANVLDVFTTGPDRPTTLEAAFHKLFSVSGAVGTALTATDTNGTYFFRLSWSQTDFPLADDAGNPVSTVQGTFPVAGEPVVGGAELLTNPGFESGLAGWTATTLGVAPLSQGVVLWTGDGGALVGDGAQTGVSGLRQTVTIPATATNPVLRVRYWIRGTDPAGDGLAITLGATELARFNTDTDGWALFTANLTAFKGQTVELALTCTSSDGASPVDYFVDAVSITPGTAPPSGGGGGGGGCVLSPVDAPPLAGLVFLLPLLALAWRRPR